MTTGTPQSAMGPASDGRRPGLSRRDFLLRAGIGAAAAIGLGTALRRALGGGRPDNPLGLDEDSMFWPREDQLEDVLRGWRP